MRGFDADSLRSLRIAAGIGPAELARVSGVSENAVRSWENSKATPLIDKLRAVMETLAQPISAVVLVPEDERYMSDLRILAGLTQPELAAKAGIPTPSLSGIERGHRPLTDRVVDDLCSALGVNEATLKAAYSRTRTRPPGSLTTHRGVET